MSVTTEHSENGRAQPMAGTGRVMLLGRYEIDPATRIAGLSRPGAPAYAAIDANEPARPIYAIIAGARQPVRLRAYHQSRQMQSEAFVSPIRIASADWPSTRRSETVLIVPRPVGQPLMESLDDKIEPMAQHRLVRTFLPALATMLAELASYRVAHRAIRPDNIFVDPETERITVGECFSVPAGLAQPAVFEPIERSLCLPAGRGEGDAADDLFALGVTILFLIFGQNPVADLDAETLALRRRQLGSYVALVGKRRVPTELIQMLRSLLRDEPADRWSVDDLLGWLHNGRGAAAPIGVKIECSRPFEIGDRRYKTAPTLALGLAGDWKAATGIVKSGTIEKWLDKAHKDKRSQAAMARCRVSGANGPRNISDDLLVARTLLALDPNGPLRYRDIVVMPDGVGPMLANVLDDATRLKTLIEMLNGMLPAFWMEQKNRPTYAMLSADETLTRVLPMLAQQAAGFGIERVLYELNAGIACQSPLVVDANCGDVTQLLQTLDRRAVERDAVFDRHIAAFCAARVSGSVDRDLNDIALASQAGARLLAQLQLLGYVQAKSDALELPGLCRYFFNKSPAILGTYRNVELRAKLARQAKSAVESGDLAKLERILGNEKNQRWDASNFSAARKQFLKDDSEVNALQQSFAAIPERSRSVGKQVGALAAGAMGLATTVVVLLTQVA